MHSFTMSSAAIDSAFHQLTHYHSILINLNSNMDFSRTVGLNSSGIWSFFFYHYIQPGIKSSVLPSLKPGEFGKKMKKDEARKKNVKGVKKKATFKNHTAVIPCQSKKKRAKKRKQKKKAKQQKQITTKVNAFCCGTLCSLPTPLSITRHSADRV